MTPSRIISAAALSLAVGSHAFTSSIPSTISCTSRTTSSTSIAATPMQSSVGNLHGQGSCFLPLLQNDDEYIAPRIVQVSHKYITLRWWVYYAFDWVTTCRWIYAVKHQKLELTKTENEIERKPMINYQWICFFIIILMIFTIRDLYDGCCYFYSRFCSDTMCIDDD